MYCGYFNAIYFILLSSQVWEDINLFQFISENIIKQTSDRFGYRLVNVVEIYISKFQSELSILHACYIEQFLKYILQEQNKLLFCLCLNIICFMLVELVFSNEEFKWGCVFDNSNLKIKTNIILLNKTEFWQSSVFIV